MRKHIFLETTPNDNIEFAAQQILTHFTTQQLVSLNKNFEKLDDALFKSWAKELTFNELKQALQIISELDK